jgi:hypothetical protein
MNDLIQSLPSPSPIAGITQTWMWESWMVDFLKGKQWESLVASTTLILYSFSFLAL